MLEYVPELDMKTISILAILLVSCQLLYGSRLRTLGMYDPGQEVAARTGFQLHFGGFHPWITEKYHFIKKIISKAPPCLKGETTAA